MSAGRLLGRHEDGVVEERAWRLRKAKALVKLLALAPERRLHRERLADLLWPDRDADAAANNLHQVLHAARARDRRRRPAPQRRRRRLEAEVDVDAFEAAAARARATREAAAYERALDLHAGELLPEDRYEPWADARRAALLELHGALCVELAELYGDDAQAIAALQRALVVDPLAERAHRALMRALRGHRAPPAGAGAVPAAAPAARRRAGGRARSRDARASTASCSPPEPATGDARQPARSR